MAEQRYLIFISYRGSDQNWATEFVYARMTEAFGADTVFKAGNALRAGESYPPVLRRQAVACPVMLVCIGPGWLEAGAPEAGRRLDSPDDWVRLEITLSLHAGNHVVPLLIGNHDEVRIPTEDQIPEDLRDLIDRQAHRLAPGAGLDVTVPMLVERLVELVPELGERRTGAAPRRDATTPTPAPGNATPVSLSSALDAAGRPDLW
ncbi:hypothetical protein CcI49_19550 [Frankia sp. CcI49]|uniref:TIR domain-containing protein n=1 Tax=Frankia sp. CcI49 TaxID=1745382 RepID=UPI0009D5B0B9|nr:TIR domain-containing protein [Frankia sp. CcI49]ONH58915.1 hypothetical protein CcI49_19550 [Frankia sp. CcI49]